jgi:hypothetical protein
MEALSVRFTNRGWTPSYEGSLTVHGVLRTEPDGLVLEFSATENYWGVKPTVESGIRTNTIPWTDIQSITYRPRFLGLGGSLVLQTRSLRALDGLPTARGSEVRLSVARSDRLTARDLAATVEMVLADRRLAALDAAGPFALPPS